MINKSRFINKDFKTLNQIQIPRPIESLKKIIVISLVALILILTVTPWRQTARGFGYVIALDPNNRAQSINATVNGRINQWFVTDGSRVKAGDKLVEIVDNDPLILERIKSERDAKKRKLQNAQIASDTGKINYLRQEELLKKGLSSNKDFEEANQSRKKIKRRVYRRSHLKMQINRRRE